MTMKLGTQTGSLTNHLYSTVAKRADGWHVIDRDGYDISYVGYATKKEAIESLRVMLAEERAHRRIADRIDGYDRDDLGESPDY